MLQASKATTSRDHFLKESERIANQLHQAHLRDQVIQEDNRISYLQGLRPADEHGDLGHQPAPAKSVESVAPAPRQAGASLVDYPCRSLPRVGPKIYSDSPSSAEPSIS